MSPLLPCYITWIGSYNVGLGILTSPSRVRVQIIWLRIASRSDVFTDVIYRRESHKKRNHQNTSQCPQFKQVKENDGTP